MTTTLCLLALLAGPTLNDLSADVAGQVVRLRWTTDVPTTCMVAYGPGLQQAAPEDPNSLRGSTNAGRDTGEGYANNHRLDLPLPEGWPFEYRITGTDAEGTAFTTETQSLARPNPPRSSVDRAQVQVNVTPGQVAGQPVVLGIPFPQGHLAQSEQIRIVFGGQEVVSQAEAVTRYPDQTIKWLRVSFTPPADAKSVSLEYGREVQRATPGELFVAIAPDQPEFDVNSDALQVTQDKLQAGATQLGFPQPVLTESDGTEVRGVLRRVEVEESGPVRTVLLLHGDFKADRQPDFRYLMRLHLFAGQPNARLDFTFQNAETSQEMSRLRALRLDFPGFPSTPVTVGQGQATYQLAVNTRVVQREDFAWVAGSLDGAPTAKGKRIDGLVSTAGLGVGVRDFWQQYPAAIACTDDTLRVELYPALPDGFYADRKDEDKLYYQLRTGQHEFRQGFAKTHELWLDLSGSQLAGLLADPPVACADPQWIEQTGAMRDLTVACSDQFPEFDQRQEHSIDQYLGVRDAHREYGLMNFGDWYGERTWNWGNLEYDLGHAFLMLYARSGYAPFFHRATEAVRHQRDVDTRHNANDPRRVGQQWIHSLGHTGGYYPPEYKDMHIYASPGWSDNRGHIWVQGQFEQYLLGGDRRSYNCAKLISDWAAGPQTTNFRFGNAREPGWMTILTMGAYNATQDPYYLNAARLMLRATHEQSLATGDHGFYYHKLPNGHCNCEEKHYGEAGFMLGVLMTGMKMTYDVTGDEQLADDITKIAKFIVETMYVPEQRAFRYTSCPMTGASGGSVFIELEGLAFAANRTHDPHLTQVVRDAVAASWDQIAGAGKSAGYMLCSLPQGLTQFSTLPGPSLADQYAKVQRWLKSPARRPVPALVPNGDFEDDANGWAPRAGFTVTRDTTDPHSGQACLRIVADGKRQNEYVNTRYDSSGDPYEIRWLKPGVTYRFTAWVKVVKLNEGTPAPDLRLQFRDTSGSKGSVKTTPYDLTKLGTWQALTADIAIPDYNTRNYLALNTNSHDAIQGELYLDDVSLVPLDLAKLETYAYHRLDPGAARTALKQLDDQGEPWLVGAGAAGWQADLPAGTYRLWLKVDGPAGALAEVTVGTQTIRITGTGEAAWFGGDEVKLPGSQVTVTVKLLGGAARLGRVVLTDDPTEP